MEKQWDKEAGQGDKDVGMDKGLGWTGRDARLQSWLLGGQRGPSPRDHEGWGSAERPCASPCLCTRQRIQDQLLGGHFLEASIFCFYILFYILYTLEGSIFFLLL